MGCQHGHLRGGSGAAAKKHPVVSDGPERPASLAGVGFGNVNMPPERWALTFTQFYSFVHDCRSCLKEWHNAVNEGKQGEDYVDFYAMNSHFVKPWTRGTGSSIALLMNHSMPLTANLLVSHAWQSSVFEVIDALRRYASHSMAQSNPTLFIAALSVYQAGSMERDPGPTLKQQLHMDPLARIFGSEGVRDGLGLLLVLVDTVDVYTRLWCLLEVSEALHAEVKVDCMASTLFFASEKHRCHHVRTRIDSRSAQCSVKADMPLLVDKVDKAGGYSTLDERIGRHRVAMMKSLRLIQDMHVTRHGRKTNEEIVVVEKITGTPLERLQKGAEPRLLKVGLTWDDARPVLRKADAVEIHQWVDDPQCFVDTVHAKMVRANV
eukprot:NODE_4406_length_1895_cov_8.298077.p1 GENE.NODE_4406_length_1895_cov_8.298077~~NODE_4406_length_1895_cov_8.298077.p1  ORF type:complete len:378 (+),score=87.77 NODE_4406_length_1895_cov_8.298077:177-1310(+)